MHARQRVGATREDAATAAGVTAKTVGNWEQGRNLPCLIQFRSLLPLYGVTGHRILFGRAAFGMSREATRELVLASRGFSPELRAGIEMLVTMFPQMGAHAADIEPTWVRPQATDSS